MNNIIQLCGRIEQGYQAGKSGLDPEMVDHVLDLSNHAEALAGALRELSAARELLADLACESQFDFSFTEVESLHALKVRCRGYVRQYLPEHVRHLTGE